MSLILHMKIPGAIVVASDCRIIGTEPLYEPFQRQSIYEVENKVLDPGKTGILKGDKGQVLSGHYNFVKTDHEQKTFLLLNDENKPFAVSYCGNANLNGYPTSYQINLALKRLVEVRNTADIAEGLKRFWTEKEINPAPSLLISGYKDGKASVMELKQDGSTFEHFDKEDLFGVAYHGEQAVVKALVDLGNFHFSLFRLQDAIDFCETMITTTAKIQSLQKTQQTVSMAYDLLVITEAKAEWIKRSTFELV